MLPTMVMIYADHEEQIIRYERKQNYRKKE